MKDVMIDIETWGTGVNALVVSIGAVEFDYINGNPLGKTFQVNIDPASSQACGFQINANTVDWWLEQEKAARESFTTDRISVYIAFSGLHRFTKNKRVWSNGLNFDIRILRDAFELIDMTCPWHYRDERDMRTFMDIMRLISETVADAGQPLQHLKHDALADAKFQANLMIAQWEAANVSVR